MISAMKKNPLRHLENVLEKTFLWLHQLLMASSFNQMQKKLFINKYG